MLKRFAGSSLIYTATNVLLKGSLLLLLPIYTRYLSPAEYGIVAIVTGIAGLLSTLFTLGLQGAMGRFYFDFRDDPRLLAEFWGAVVTAILLWSAACGMLLLAAGEWLLRPLVGEVPFWPFVAVGVLTAGLQPMMLVLLTVYQTREQPVRYAMVSAANFTVATAVTLATLIWFGWGPLAPLLAALVAATAVFVAGLLLLRRDIRWGWRPDHLRRALAYALPQLPHIAASQITALSDRFLLNRMASPAAVGIYNVGAMLGLAVDLVMQGVNRAFVPIAMDVYKRADAGDLDRLRSAGVGIVAFFCIAAAGVAAFSRPIVDLLAAAEFASAAGVLVIISFSGAAASIYYVTVNYLFYELALTRLVAAATITAMVCNVALNVLLIPRFGILAAAAANVLSQVVAATIVAAIGRRRDPVRWPLSRFAALFLASVGAGIMLARLNADSLLVEVALRLAGLGGLAVLAAAMFPGAFKFGLVVARREAS
jgi:O-antigen/teichoic acid export membrane protein